MTLPSEVFCNRHNQLGQITPWDTQSVHQLLCTANPTQSLRATERSLESSQLLPQTKNLSVLVDETGQSPIPRVVQQLDGDAKKKRHHSYIVQLHQSPEAGLVLFANDARKGRRWLYLDKQAGEQILAGLSAIAGDKNLIVWPYGKLSKYIRQLALEHNTHHIKLTHSTLTLGTVAYQNNTAHTETQSLQPAPPSHRTILSHLDRLEAEAIHIMREVVCQAENPAMLYSVGKDSSVMLHLAKKAFFPSLPPFPLVHVDTQWKFQAMYQFRDQAVAASGMSLITHINPEGKKRNINPFDHGSALHTDIMKTQALKQVLDQQQFDVTFGGARRDEEKSRAKERIFSFRNSSHRWQPKQQRPELWNLYNVNKNPDHSIRVFPLSNWTELDIWSYIDRENIPVVPLYFAAQRPVLERDGMLLMVDDARCEVFENEKIHIKSVRFRTLGCYPLTGAIESTANNVPAIILELLKTKNSEREGRAIDNDSSSSMEKKKQQGYF